MADLFDQKSLRIPPMMGKAARTKLNKSGSYRMPPNLKGVHSAAQGGLGGAYTKGKKLRGFSGEDGSFVDPEGENGTPMTGLFGVGGQQIKPLEANFSSGLGDDEPESNGIPDDSPEAAGAALSGVGPKSPKDMNQDDIPQQMDLGSKRIQEELSKYMPYARQQLEGMQNPREGGLNLPMLQFAAGLMSPTRTGSFGESIGTGMNMGLNALANQRKQDLDYQVLKAKLGLDIEKTPLEVATKLADIDEKNRYHQELMDWRLNKGKEGKTLPANTVDKISSTADNVSKLQGLKDSYEEGYGGKVFDTIGELQNWLGSHTEEGGELAKQANWWKDYNDYVQFVRHDLYGSAFTKSEQAAWDKANITPGMADSAIKRNLAVRADLADKALKRKISNFGKAGYNTSELEAYSVQEPSNQEEASQESADSTSSTSNEGAPETSKQIGGKNYVKKNGTWYEQ